MFYISYTKDFWVDTPGLKEMHYISWAQIGLTFPREILAHALNKKWYEVENQFHLINMKNKTVCFYPEHNITLMPNDGWEIDEVIYKHFNEALKFQNLHVKARTVVFDMRSYRYFGPNSKYQDAHEYVNMIKNSYRLTKYFGEGEDWWVLPSEDFIDVENHGGRFYSFKKDIVDTTPFLHE